MGMRGRHEFARVRFVVPHELCERRDARETLGALAAGKIQARTRSSQRRLRHELVHQRPLVPRIARQGLNDAFQRDLRQSRLDSGTHIAE